MTECVISVMGACVSGSISCSFLHLKCFVVGFFFFLKKAYLVTLKWK